MSRVIQVRVGTASESLDRFEDQWNRALAGAATPLYLVSFSDLPALLAALTLRSWQMLERLRAEGPMTIFALAKRLVPTATQLGSLDIASDQPLTVLALRLTVNQRDETLHTTTPVADLTRPLDSAPLYFPQFVDGGGYTTTLIFLNTSDAIETGKLALFDDTGAALPVNQPGGTRDSAFSYVIQPGGVFVFQTDGFPADARVGWARPTPDANTVSPVGAGIFSFSQGGSQVTESGVPAALPTTHARIYIDQSGSRA